MYSLLEIPDVILIILLGVFSYSLGSIPTAYVIGKIFRGIDIRRLGSGNVGGSNAIVHIGLIPGILISSFDILIKGWMVVFLTSHFFGGTLFLQGTIALLAIVAHNWSPWIRFNGGRGISVFFGIILGFNLFGEVIFFVCLVIIGNLIKRETGFYTFLCMLTLPILSIVFDRPIELWLICILGVIILIIKRVLANGESIVENRKWLAVTCNRILFDRDISNRQKWINRD
jgi:glycerol-3-phosphate acyltransferase PlsY